MVSPDFALADVDHVAGTFETALCAVIAGLAVADPLAGKGKEGGCRWVVQHKIVHVHAELASASATR